MDLDEIFSGKSDDPLVALARQDLDPLSVTELDARIAALEAEIERTRHKKNAPLTIAQALTAYSSNDPVCAGPQEMPEHISSA